MFLSALLMILLHHIAPVTKVISTPYSLSGFIVAIVGLLIITISAGYFRKANTTIHPLGKSTFLVTTGLYKYSRDPIYLGMLLVLIGTAILLGTLLPLIILPLFILFITNLHIKQEEDNLERLFGKDYVEYKQRVSRWI
jgi:protein-S-isoprenylcysteine O-methyltransferase Ste14